MASKKPTLNETNNDIEKVIQKKNTNTTTKKKSKPRIKKSEHKTLQSLDPKYIIVDETVERKVISSDNVNSVVGIKNVAAKSEKQLSKIFQKRPYWSINQMPYEWLYQKVFNYFNSITVDVTDKDTGEVISHKYSCTPTVADLAAFIGVDSMTLRNYVQGIQYKSDTKPYALNELNNVDYNLMPTTQYTLDESSNNSGSNADMHKALDKNERKKAASENSSKFLLIKNAYQMIEGFHEARLGMNENVSGSIFALLNMNRGWKNEHKVVQELGEETLGKIKSIDDLNNRLKGLELLSDTSTNNVIDTYQSDDGSYKAK